ncbi:MAG: DUF305 domain-containing protein [Armatimonadota bacterium]|nr:DUF305 domain-containing protein [Armatimonadota bacterium]
MKRTNWFAFAALLAVVLGGCSNPENNADMATEKEGGMTDMSAPADSPSAEMHMTMVAMNDAMAKAKMTGDTDKDFAAMMLIHHQGAIDMAELEVKHGKNAELKAMAQKMIDMQKAEQVELRKHADASH